MLKIVQFYMVATIVLSFSVFCLSTNVSIASDKPRAENANLIQEHDHIIEHSDQERSITNTLTRDAIAEDTEVNELVSLTMTVYKSPTCGCCSEWVDYMKDEGFTVNSINTDDMQSLKSLLSLTAPELHSCHTAVIDGYVIEGHVPANDVKRLLTERPDVLALTAPGMPMMSPGMGSRIPEDYNVLSIDEAGRIQLWSEY